MVGKVGVLKEDQGQGSKLTVGADDSNSHMLYNGNINITTRSAAAKRHRTTFEQGKALEDDQHLTVVKVLLLKKNGIVSE